MLLQALWRAQIARFALVGLAMTALHLLVFRLVLPWSVPEAANVIAFLTATQVNFALSYFWTWSARRPVGQETIRSVLRRALLFNGSAALGFGVNAVVFSAAHRVAGLGPTASALTATVVSAAASFLLSDLVDHLGGPVHGAVVDDGDRHAQRERGGVGREGTQRRPEPRFLVVDGDASSTTSPSVSPWKVSQR